MKTLIKKHREMKGFSQRKLGSLVGLDHRTIGNFERDITSPKLSDLERISSALGVSLADLLPQNSLKSQRAA
jgi:transcriptional regulator with XRE-family HTH domain